MDRIQMRTREASSLTEEEMLRCIVRYACRDESSAERMSSIVCSHFSTVRSLLVAPVHFLKTLELSATLIEYVSLLREYAIRASYLPIKTVFSEQNIKDFAMMMLLRIGHLTTEVILGMLFTKEKRFLCTENMALGSVNTAVFDTQTVIEALNRHKASYVILVHNHPSGYCLPSEEDEKTTSIIAEACKECGYNVLDHYIVTHNAVYSMYMQEYCILL